MGHPRSVCTYKGCDNYLVNAVKTVNIRHEFDNRRLTVVQTYLVAVVEQIAQDVVVACGRKSRTRIGSMS